MKNLSSVDEDKDNVTKEYADVSQYGKIDWYGHSLSTFTDISSDRNQGLSQRVSANLGADANDRTVPGASSSLHDGSVSGFHFGGWSSVYRENSAPLTSNKFEPRRSASVVYYGINDLGKLGTSIDPFINSMTAICSRLNAAAVYEDTDGSISYSSGWTDNPISPSTTYYASGNSYKTCNTAVSRNFTITVPSSFPGGTIAVAFLTNPSGHGGSFSFTVDGNSAGTLDCRNVQAKDYGTGSNGAWTPSVKRLTGLSSGTHSIVVTVTNVNSIAIFDCWWAEAESLPLIVLPMMHRCTDYSSYSSGPFTPSDSDVTSTLNPAIESVASQFTNVITVDTDTAINKQSKYLSDGLHLSSIGMAVVAEQIQKSIQTAVRTREEQSRGSFEPGFISKTPSSSNRNVIRSVFGVTVPLTVRGTELNNQTADLQRWQVGESGNTVAKINSEGGIRTATSGFNPAFTQSSSMSDSHPLMAINAYGQLLFGEGGSNPTDITLYRRASHVLSSTGTIESENVDDGFKTKASGFGRALSQWNSFSDTNPQFQIGSSGVMLWGPGGSSALDTSIARNDAGQLVSSAIVASNTGSLPAFQVNSNQGSGAAFDANSEGKIINVVDPTSAQDAATKSYSDTKRPLNVYSVIQTVDGSAVSTTGSISVLKNVFRVDGPIHLGAAIVNAPALFYLDPNDYSVSGKTTKLRVRAGYMTNATSPAITVTAGLYPISTPAGGANVGGFTIGTVISGSTVAKALTANNSMDGSNSGDFDMPSAGWYALGTVGSGTQASNSWIGIHLELQIRHV